jgi:hypothetical protein
MGWTHERYGDGMKHPFISFSWFTAPSFGMWLRVYGYGICITTMDPLFSERMGYKKTWRIGRLRLKFLKAD